MTKPITSRVHGVLDYPVGLLLIASPWIFGFHDVGGAAVTLPILIGAIALLQSTITDYEQSVVDMIPLRMHLVNDIIAGTVLAASPWLFGFADEGTSAWLPHLVFGLLLLGSGLLTRGERETDKAPIGNPSAPGGR